MYDVTHSMVAGLGVAGGARYAAGPRSGHQSEGGRRRLLWTAWELLWTVGATLPTVDWTSNTHVSQREEEGVGRVGSANEAGKANEEEPLPRNERRAPTY